jgi:uncharacterized protein YndB with AHSA1/START domain
MTEVSVLEVSVHIAATPETVFPYFTDPARYVRWMGSEATLDPVPGGTYYVNMREGVQVAGEFVEVDPPLRLVFTLGWANDTTVPPGSTRLVVTLEPRTASTRVVLRHHNLPDDEQRSHHRLGWEMYLGRLGVSVLGGNPGPDPNA